MDFYLGIDIGTSRVKAVLFDQHFTACASAAENTSRQGHTRECGNSRRREAEGCDDLVSVL